MKIAIGSDHAGWKLKAALVQLLKNKGFAVLDVGCENSTRRVDYPDYAQSVAQAVAGKKARYGVLCCGTGIGMSIAANKIPGIRASVAWNEKSASLAQEHNAANILCLGGRLLSKSKAAACLWAFLNSTPSSAPRHRQRIEKIRQLEK